MKSNLDELNRLAYENACIRCQYYVDGKCFNRGECVWKGIREELEAFKVIKDKSVFMWGFQHRFYEGRSYAYYLSHIGYFHSGFGGEKQKLTEDEFNLLDKTLPLLECDL